MKSNDLNFKSNSVIEQKKFYNFLKEKPGSRKSHLLFFKYVLSDPEKSHFTKGLNFNIPCKKFDYADYLVNFELFFEKYTQSRHLKQK